MRYVLRAARCYRHRSGIDKDGVDYGIVPSARGRARAEDERKEIEPYIGHNAPRFRINKMEQFLAF